MRELVKSNLLIRSKEVNLSGVLKQALYFCLSMVALILSGVFPMAEKQLIVLSLITGAKWIIAGGINKINILIKGGEDGL